MKSFSKLILVSNDDGYQAAGATQLAAMMRAHGDVVMVAPDGGRSGSSLSISAHEPVRIWRVKHEEAGDGQGSLTVWACTGTPSDCVKMAFEKILPRVPDLVAGGINHGENSAVNAHYSGTVAVAIEGCIKGVPSVAFSCGRTDSEADFGYMAGVVRGVTEGLLEEGLPAGVCLNVNVPDVERPLGMRVCRMGMGEWREEWVEREHPRGGKYYWIAGYYDPADGEDEETDTWAYRHGYVAVTPLQLDMTARGEMERMRKRFAET